jgi:hypothetical protein
VITCKFGEPAAVEGWKKKIVAFEPCSSLPAGPLAPELPRWTEGSLERSLLHRPDVLAMALGVPMPCEILALRQVARIDLYLRCPGGLHLLEIKRPTEHRRWLSAAQQVARQWAAAAVWLRRGTEPVHLWALVPARWSKSLGCAKVASNCQQELADIARTLLVGPAVAELGALFYCAARCANERVLFFWRADEEPPTLKQGNRPSLSAAQHVVPADSTRAS